MFNFSKIESPHKLNKDFILSKINEETIFFYYHGPFELNKVYPSKLRKDIHASCGFYLSRSGHLIYNDLAKKDFKFDCFDFVSKLYNLSFADTLKKIIDDFGLNGGVKSERVESISKQLKDFDKSFKKQTRIIFKPDAWTEENLNYWKQYHISQEELERENIYPIKKLWINDSPISNKNNEIRYALTLLHKEEMLTKLYSPEGSSLKWLSNIPIDVPFGLNNFNSSGDKCIIAKAVKDMIVLKKFFPSVIATQNESEGALSDKVLKKLKFLFGDNIYILWDNDEKGIEEMESLQSKGFKTLHVPIEERLTEGIKDFSDLAWTKGLGAVEHFLKQNKLI